MQVFTDNDAKPASVRDHKVAIIGYGSQGRAHALNLKDSGCDVIIGLREGSSTTAKAQAAGFTVMSVAEASKAAKLVAILTPDMSHEAIFDSEIAPNLEAGDALLFAHGFTVLYERVKPADDIDVIMVAPKGPGDLVRREYERGAGVPCLFAVHQDASGEARDKALGYAALIGGTVAGAIQTTFREETETDLFGEQAVLCGGATELVVAGYETLTEAGYAPEIAYYECLHELKLIVDLLYEGGLTKMHEFISETAIYGDLVSGPRVINDETRARMKDVLTDIQNGTFARNWVAENEAGKPKYNAMLEADMNQPIEETGKRLRAMMPWLQQKRKNAA
ncbi:ketol-acid reductoisomerase [Pseudoblastomonas halimionae]|uniref:Ketol-acid reductoisomerase (NADP(+)) n=1 Tax=Alteriqipengyuania halimionae TaxID=1926630 RepID=A0A6I4U348_9SPHN|nr:ketol-acid reductoisomerase [Alteriqipengyuania halimionae]MXP09373.1 ketol-acid reductoisomerase [Alteriqipengyuania halimionae]